MYADGDDSLFPAFVYCNLLPCSNGDLSSVW